MAGSKNYTWSFRIILLASLLFYFSFAYVFERTDHWQIAISYIFLFSGYLFIYQWSEDDRIFKVALVGAIVFRLIFAVSIPELSDDFYRFIWDGRLWLDGINPFWEVPSYYVNSLGQSSLTYFDPHIYTQLNSDNPTVYPTVNQIIFGISAGIFPDSVLGSVIVLRVFVIAAEIGTLILLTRLLKANNIPRKRLILYALNPLVILEFSGNLHFEGIMIFFVLMSVWWLLKSRIFAGALWMALAVATKLLPLIYFPLFIKRLGIQRSILFFIMAGSLTAILLIPLLDPIALNSLLDGLTLYFHKFEFNASVYYLVREVGFWVKGYNIIQTAGTWLAIITAILIFGFAFMERKSNRGIFEAMMWVSLIYIALSSIVHPWYILPGFAFSLFTRFRFMAIWTFLIFFSYLGYTETGYKEYYGYFAAEYIILALFILREFLPSPQRQVR